MVVFVQLFIRHTRKIFPDTCGLGISHIKSWVYNCTPSALNVYHIVADGRVCTAVHSAHTKNLSPTLKTLFKTIIINTKGETRPFAQQLTPVMLSAPGPGQELNKTRLVPRLTNTQRVIEACLKVCLRAPTVPRTKCKLTHVSDCDRRARVMKVHMTSHTHTYPFQTT